MKVTYNSYLTIPSGNKLANNVIIIANPDAQVDLFYKGYLRTVPNLLYMEFWDRQAFTAKERLLMRLCEKRPKLCVAMGNFLRMSPLTWHPPLKADAAQLRDFIDALRGRGDIDVFCEYGRSRSRAIAEYIEETLGYELVHPMRDAKGIGRNEYLYGLLKGEARE